MGKFNDSGRYNLLEDCERDGKETAHRLEIAFGVKWVHGSYGSAGIGFEYSCSPPLSSLFDVSVHHEDGGFVACDGSGEDSPICETPEEAVRAFARQRINEANERYGHFAGLVTNQNQDD